MAETTATADPIFEPTVPAQPPESPPEALPEAQSTASAPPPADKQPDKQLTETLTDKEAFDRINQGIDSNIKEGEIRISRLALCQPQSKEITKSLPGYEKGMILDNLTREVLSTYDYPPWMVAAGVEVSKLQKVHFVPVLFVFKLPTEYIAWVPKTEQKPGDPRWTLKTLDINHPDVQKGIWKSKGGSFTGKKPPVTDNTNFLLSVINTEFKVPNGTFRVGTFSRTSSACGQTVTSMLVASKMQSQYPWARAYYLYSKQEENEHGVFYTFQLAPGPKFSDIAEPFIAQMHKDMALALTDKANGKYFQMTMINSAHLEEDDEVPNTGDGATDGSEGAATTADPFADPNAAKDKEPGF